MEEGSFYGWPFANGNNVLDPDLGVGREEEIAAAVPPVHGFRAHNAPLGMTFVRGDQFPEAYRGAAIVALHGSWNRSQKDGYKVVSLHFQEDGSVVERDFVSGFLKDEDVIGQPAEVQEGPDGTVYIADDFAGAIYRVASGVDQSLFIPEVVAPVYDAEESLSGLSESERERWSRRGKEVFDARICITCHGDAEGTKPLENIGRRFNIDGIKALLEKPTAPMPMLDLSEEEKKALAVYLISEF